MNRAVRAILSAVLGVGLWAAGFATSCAAGEVEVWTPRSGALQQGFLATFEAELAAKGLRVARIVDLSAGDPPPSQPARVVVALGLDASRRALQQQGTQVLSVLVSRRDAATLAELRPLTEFAAIALDQPLPRRLAMLKILAPEVKSVAVLLGDVSSDLEPGIGDAIRAAGLEPRIASIAREQEIVPSLERILTQDAALLTIPDATVFNRDTIMSILLTSYRHRRPVVGFTAAYVRAGAVAGVFSDPEDVAIQAARHLYQAEAPERFPKGVFAPTEYRVAINERVSRSLGLPALSEGELLRQLKAREREQ